MREINMQEELVEVIPLGVQKRNRVFIRDVALGTKVRLEDYPHEIFTYTGKHYGWFMLRSDRRELLVGHYRYVEEL